MFQAAESENESAVGSVGTIHIRLIALRCQEP